MHGRRSVKILATVKRLLLLLAVNAVILVAAAELLALSAYYFQTGWLFYLNPYRPAFETVAAGGAGRLTDMGLHPYFGPVHRAGIPVEIPASMQDAVPGVPLADKAAGFATNNFGFATPHDFPYVKTDPRQFVIGVFGGSVGVWFCQLGMPRVIELLKQRPFFRDRPIVPLCFSHEGYKQPQQLMVLTYFLSIGQQFDLAINVDGFNEVALSRLNQARGFDLSMPSVMHLEGLRTLIDGNTLTPEKLRSLSAIDRDRQRLDSLVPWLNQPRLAAVYVVLERYYRIVQARYQTELARFAALPPADPGRSALHVTAPLAERAPAPFFDEVARMWVRTASLMQDALARQGATFVGVLQPNQYATSRRFSEEEATVALNPESAFKPGAEQGYPALVTALKALPSGPGRPHIFDATHVLDDEPAPVYVDDCCHLTKRGNELLAAFVARAILTVRPDW
jgi:hypothetical protein